MRIRLRGGELRIYAGSLEKFNRLSLGEIKRHLEESPKGEEYLKHFKANGLWLCINCIDSTRRRIEPSKEASIIKAPKKKKPRSNASNSGAKIKDCKNPKISVIN